MYLLQELGRQDAGKESIFPLSVEGNGGDIDMSCNTKSVIASELHRALSIISSKHKDPQLGHLCFLKKELVSYYFSKRI